MRRCSFSSSVLARLRGGSAVFGSGSTWPHDLRFLTGRDSEPDGAGVDDGSEVEAEWCAGEGVSKGTWRSSILMVVGAASVVGGVRGVEAISVDVFMVWEKYESKVCSIPIV